MLKKIEEVENEEKKEEVKKEVVQIPVFLSREDINSLIYENNLLLKQLISALQKK